MDDSHGDGASGALPSVKGVLDILFSPRNM